MGRCEAQAIGKAGGMMAASACLLVAACAAFAQGSTNAPWEKIVASQAEMEKCGEEVAEVAASRWTREGGNKYSLQIPEVAMDEIGMGSTAATVLNMKQSRTKAVVNPNYVVIRRSESRRWCGLGEAYVVYTGSGLAGSMRAFGPIAR